MFQSIWTALIGLGFALLVGTIADLLFKRSDFKWYWNLLFGVIGLFVIGPLIVNFLGALGVTLPLTLFGLPVAWVDLAWQLIFGVIGTFILLIILNAIFWKKDADGNDRRAVREDRRDIGVPEHEGNLPTDSRNRVVTDDLPSERIDTRTDVHDPNRSPNVEIRDLRDNPERNDNDLV